MDLDPRKLSVPTDSPGATDRKKEPCESLSEKAEYGRFTILVVDDEEPLREAIAFDFKRKGFQVITAEDGTKGLEQIKAHKVDLVLSDVRMPNGDGMFLLDQIQKLERKVPLIFITGFTDHGEAECLARGAIRVISKPFDRKFLMKCALEALEAR